MAYGFFHFFIVIHLFIFLDLGAITFFFFFLTKAGDFDKHFCIFTVAAAIIQQHSGNLK